MFRSFRWAWQRSVRGYADCDWWNLDYWFIDVLAPMFEEYAEKHIGYPGEINGFTDEQWAAYLKDIASHLRNASEDQTVQANEYDDAWRTMVDRRNADVKIWTDDKGFVHHVWPDPTTEQMELTAKYIARLQEIDAWRLNEAQTAFRMIGDQFFSLCD